VRRSPTPICEVGRIWFFFGFTYCPDIFPTTLSAFTARFETLGRR
jgi:cytochrome oxidase Cu insertion factor (SCO1/SenC/PrrC family)